MRVIVRISIGLTLCFSLVAPLRAALTGDIEGSVYDQQGATIQTARVSIKSMNTAAKRELSTNSYGQFAALQLDLGEYEVKIEKENFRTYIATATVRSGETTRLNVTMQVGTTSETLTIEGGAAPVLDVASSQLSTSVDAQSAVYLPNQGRDPVAFATLAPGIVPVTKDNPFLGSGSFNSNGSRGRANNITVDNVTSTDISTTGSSEVGTFSLDAIQEAKVITNNFLPEFGRNSGAQVQLITKSGTNNYHGSVYWFHQNAAFNARDYFDTTGAATPLRYNLWGFTAGGPIIKDKTFIFGDYEGNKIRGAGSSAVATVMTPAQATAITDPTSAALFAGVGAPTSSTGTLTSPGSQATDAHSWLLKVDQLIRGGKDALTMRYSENPFNGTSPSLTFILTNLPNYGATNNFTDRQVNFGYTSAISSSVVNQFRFLYGRSNPAFPVNTTLKPPFGPTLEISGLAVMGISRILPQGRIQNTYQYSDSLSWVKGRHSFKFGADVLRYLAPSFFDSSVRGRASFGGGVAGFEAGQLTRWRQNFGATTKHNRSTDMFWFAQDEIRMTNSLTLDVGFRLESSGGVSDLDETISNLDLSSTVPVGGGGTGPLGGIDLGGTAFKRNWNPAPRLGFAWNPNHGKLVVRGGYGIAYDFIFYNPITNLRFSAPFVPGIDVTSFGGPVGCTTHCNTLANFVAGTAQAQLDAISSIGTFLATQKNFGTLSPVQQNLKNPRNQQFSLGMEYELKKDFVLKFTGTHTKNDFLQASVPLNLTQAALRPAPATSEADELARANQFISFFKDENGNASGTLVNNRIDPRFNGVTQVQSTASSNYNSLQIEAVKRMGHGLSFNTSYTWAHSIDNVSDALGVLVNDSAGLMDPRNLHLNRANSEFDVRHRWILSYVYQLPFAKHFEGPVHKILEGWAFSNIVEMRSGLPVTIFSGDRRGISDNYLLGGTTGTMQANGDVSKLVIGGDYSDLCGRGINTSAVDNCTNTLNFPLTQPLLGNPGNSGRNKLRLDGLRNVDFAVIKDTKIMEGKNLQFRWEFYNILNTPSFSSFDNILTDPTFGTYQGTATNMRQMQAALKFTF